jgi:lipopolysaccharide transport system permease protein
VAQGYSHRESETVYNSASQLKDPIGLAVSMFRDLGHSRGLAWRLFVRNLSARYRQTILGYVWAFLPPVVATAVFIFLRRSGFFLVEDTGVSYVAFLFTGVVLWQTFVDAIFSPIRMVNQSRAMLRKINFPHEALLLAGLAEVLFNAMIRAVLLAGVLIWQDVTVPVTVFLAPLGLAVLILVALGIGVLAAPFAMLFNDIEQALAVFLTLWMFVTPVLYPPPTTWPGSLTMRVNPVAPVLDTARAWILTGNPKHLFGFIVVAGVTLVLLFLGWVLYRLALPIAVERMGS